MLARASRILLAPIVLMLSLSATPAANAAQIISWGSDSNGQVSATPSGTDFTALAAGDSHSLALAADGSIAAWGADAYGQVSGTPSGTGFTAIAAGGFHNLALAAGSIVAWGWNGFGQVSGAPLGTGHTAIAAGFEHSHAIDANGILLWGYPVYFQGCFPNGTYLAVDGGFAHSVALTTNGSIVSCGNNQAGQISGTPSGTGFTAVAAGDFHSVALAANGSIAAWGGDGYGQVSGTPSGTGFIAIAAGASHNLALAANGSIVAWGRNTDGQVSGTPLGSGFTGIAAGFGHSVALRGDAGGSPGCPPSINCPAPEPSDPLSVARLVLFPGTASVVRDNDPTSDLDPQCGVISVANVPFPDDPFASFTGTLYLDPPTSSNPGELVATNATIVNSGAAVLSRGDIPFACGEFYSPGPNPVPGSLAVQIDGELETTDGTAMTAGGEELEITGVGRTFSVPTEPWTPPAEVLTSWINPGPAPAPVLMSATAAKSGTYAPGPGIIGLKMNIHLPQREAMELPTSIAATVPEPGTLAQLASGALGLALLYRQQARHSPPQSRAHRAVGEAELPLRSDHRDGQRTGDREASMAQYTVYRPDESGSWSAFDQLRREMDGLFSRFNGAPSGSVDWRGVFPPVNLYETPDAYQLTAELPGVEAEAIRISLEGSTLVLEGERRIDYASRKEMSLHRRERQAGAFRRAFELPGAVDADGVDAVHRNGILMLRLPKTPESQPRQISVRRS